LTVSAKSKEEEHKAQAIKKVLEQRCNNFRDNQTKMYDSLLNRERQVIVLDRCLDNSTQNLGLLTSENDVKRETARHFQRVTDTYHHNETIPVDWTQWYSPLADIDPNIYNDLMIPPTEDEWYNIILALPLDKAPGPSKISNEMLRHLGSRMKKVFWIFVCECLTLSLTPDR
jgi:hypothetical protein